jgi:hypothetical protein
MDFLRSTAVAFVSPLKPQECRDRLSAELGKPIDDHVRCLAGSVTESRLRLRVRNVYGHPGGSFQTLLYADMRPEGAGTRIGGTLGVHPFTRVTVLATLIFLAFVAFAIAFGEGTTGKWFAGLAIFAMPAIIYFGLRAARDEGPFLTESLARLLDAKQEVGPRTRPEAAQPHG